VELFLATSRSVSFSPTVTWGDWTKPVDMIITWNGDAEGDRVSLIGARSFRSAEVVKKERLTQLDLLLLPRDGKQVDGLRQASYRRASCAIRDDGERVARMVIDVEKEIRQLRASRTDRRRARQGPTQAGENGREERKVGEKGKEEKSVVLEADVDADAEQRGDRQPLTSGLRRAACGLRRRHKKTCGAFDGP